MAVMASTFNHRHLPSQSEPGNAAFCTPDNVLNSIAYINQEFELLGLPLLSVSNPSKINFDVIFLINRLQEVFSLYHKTVRIKDDIQNRNHRLLCDLDHHQSTQVRLKQKAELTEKELYQEKEKCRQYNLKYKQVSSKMRTECEEVKRLKMALQSRDVQHKHELNKKEKEINKLKERLHQLLADKVPDRKVGMDLMSLVTGNDGRRATWKTSHGKQEEETYQILINNFEVRHQELIQENGELRDCLLFLKRELSSLWKNSRDITGVSVSELSDESKLCNSGTSDNDALKSTNQTVSDLGQGHFQLPVDMMRQQVERSFKVTCEQIRQMLRLWHKGKSSTVDSSPLKPPKAGELTTTGKDSLGKRRSSMDRRNSLADSTDTEKLRQQIINYKAIIQQQEDLIQKTLALPQHAKESSFIHESPFIREKENLSQQKKMFSEEKVNFDRERKIFTEAAIRLAKERKAFEEERSALLKQHFLSMSPFRVSQTAKFKGEGQSNRLLPATPVYSPASSKHKPETDLPSTPELFKALGLTAELKSSPSQDFPSTAMSATNMNLTSLESPTHMSSNQSVSSTSTSETSSISPKAAACGGGRRTSLSHTLSHNSSSSPSTPSVEDIKASLMAKHRHL